MYIRPATPADIGYMGEISAYAFQTDNVPRYSTPGLDQHWDDWRRWILYRNRLRMWSANVWGHCAVADETDEGWPNGKIMGYAFWRRDGESAEAYKWHRKSWSEALERTLSPLVVWYMDLFDKSASREKRQIVRDFKMTARDPIQDDQWDLDILAVHPNAQRRGIGEKLMQWGMDRAREEGIPIQIIAKPAGMKLYLKCGCLPLYELHFPEPLDFLWGTVLVWEPENLKGKWTNEENLARLRKQQASTSNMVLRWEKDEK